MKIRFLVMALVIGNLLTACSVSNEESDESGGGSAGAPSSNGSLMEPSTVLPPSSVPTIGVPSMDGSTDSPPDSPPSECGSKSDGTSCGGSTGYCYHGDCYPYYPCTADNECPQPSPDACSRYICTGAICMVQAVPDGQTCGQSQTCDSGYCQ